MLKKYAVFMLIILTFFTLSLFAQEDIVTEQAEYIAKLADFNVLIDGIEPLTGSPILTVDDKIYFPLSGSIADQLCIETNARTISSSLGLRIHWEQLGLNKSNEEKLSLKITTDIPVTEEKKLLLKEKLVGISRVKEIVGQLSLGMDVNDVRKIITEEPYLNMSSRHCTTYRFAGEEELVLDYKDFTGKLESAYSTSDFGLSPEEYKEYPAKNSDIPLLVNGKEFFTTNPVILANYYLVYISLADLEKMLDIKSDFNEEENLLNITTKQEAK